MLTFVVHVAAKDNRMVLFGEDIGFIKPHGAECFSDRFWRRFLLPGCSDAWQQLSRLTSLVGNGTGRLGGSRGRTTITCVATEKERHPEQTWCFARCFFFNSRAFLVTKETSTTFSRRH